MAILTKNAILQALAARRITVEPLHFENLGPNSLDLTLGHIISYYPFVKMNENGETDRGDTVTIGQLDQELRPEDYGHMATRIPTDPSVTHIRELPLMDLAHYQDTYQEEIPETGFVIWPGNVYLVKVNETIWCADLVTEVAGLSRISRAGVSVHQTAARANIGDKCQFVLELTAMYPTVIYPDMRIATAFFLTTEGAIADEDRYQGRYMQSKQPNPNIITGYVPDVDLVEKVANLRKKLEEEAMLEEAKYAAEQEEAPVENVPVDGFVDVPATNEALDKTPESGDTIDMGDVMPGFSAKVVATEVNGSVAPQEFDAEVIAKDPENEDDASPA